MCKTISSSLFLLLFLTIVPNGVGQSRLLALTLTNSTGTYDIDVTTDGLKSVVSIALKRDGKASTIGRYETPATFLYARPSYPEPNRLITLWETGTIIKAVVLAIAPSSHPEVLFDENSEGEPDFLHGGFVGDLMLIYSGRSFESQNGLWVPEVAKLYHWNGHKYLLVDTVPYHERCGAVARYDKAANATRAKR